MKRLALLSAIASVSALACPAGADVIYGGPVPEPSVAALIMLGLGCLLRRRRA